MSLHNSGVSPGEIGGTFAGAVALLATVGAGIRWVLGWKERRAATLHQKLLKWEQKLEAREARLDAEQADHMAAIERRLVKLERQNAALRSGYQIVATELRIKEPGNERLRHADQLLRFAFEADPIVPPEMEEILSRLPTKEGEVP